MSGTLITQNPGNLQPRNRQIMRRGDDIDPFLVLRLEMDRVFDDLFRGFGMPSLPPPPFGRVSTPMLAPHIDVSETDQEIRISAELPGIDEQDVEVSLVDDILTISGEKRVEQQDKDRNYRVVERARGRFSRSLRLPFRIDPGQVQATVKDGVLTITIPKPREVQEKTSRIEVTRHNSPGVNATSAAAGSTESTPASTPPAGAKGEQQRAAE